jgi:acyl carrier protein
MDIELKVLNEIFKKAFEVDIIIDEDTSKSSEILWDSINHLNLIIELEDFLKISFDSDEIEGLTSVKKILQVLKNK